jgi:hypothetical protein|tara:strand:+ start:1105 stop:1392 length:288 start_codon:yes stop_codon:yes gene_type:complete
MNRKQSKRISKQSKVILVDWLRSLLPEEEASKINTTNCLDFIPEQTHFIANRTLYLNAYHPKWIRNKIKRMLRLFPDRSISDITFEDIQWLMQKN